MDPISEEFVDDVCEELVELSPEKGYEQSVEAAKKQPEVMTFISEMTEDLDEEFRGLAIYMFFVIYRMFEKAYEKEIEMVTADEIIESYKTNEELMNSLEGVHEQFFERIAQVQMAYQPYVIRFVVESLFEALQEENPVLLGEEDMGFIFLMMKTVIDVLNVKTV